MPRKFAAAAKRQSRTAPSADPREEYVPHRSEWVARAWYRDVERVVIVEFHDGHRHMYSDVDAATWRRFTEAPSAGGFVRSELGAHPHRAV